MDQKMNLKMMLVDKFTENYLFTLLLLNSAEL